MATRKIPRADWQSYFDRVSEALGGTRVTIEVASLAVGDQIAADEVALNGLVYDPKSDVFEVVTDTLDHMVRKPKEIYVQETGGGLASLEVVDADGAKQIVKLTAPLAIAGPAA